MWNERYAEDGFAYGLEPNGFLVEHADRLSGSVLCIASGEGRNAVWLAERGLDVHGVDGSSVGVEKTRRLAAERGVNVSVSHADLAEFDLGRDQWDGIVAIFAHLPPPLRERVHRAIPRALKAGGVLLLEAYAPGQLGRGTGGPPALPMLYSVPTLRDELAGLRFDRLEETERAVVEGTYHTGSAITVQVVGVR